MIEFLTTNFAEIIMVALTTVLGGIWAVIARVVSQFKDDMSERKQMWELEMQKIHSTLDDLMSDHKDIKRMQSEGAEKIISLEKQHSEHERDQAVQLEILRDLKEMARNQ